MVSFGLQLEIVVRCVEVHRVQVWDMKKLNWGLKPFFIFFLRLQSKRSLQGIVLDLTHPFGSASPSQFYRLEFFGAWCLIMYRLPLEHMA